MLGEKNPCFMLMPGACSHLSGPYNLPLEKWQLRKELVCLFCSIIGIGLLDTDCNLHKAFFYFKSKPKRQKTGKKRLGRAGDRKEQWF